MSDQVTPSAAPAAESTSNVEGQNQEQNQDGQEAKPDANAAPKKKAPSFRKLKIGNEEVALSDEDIARDYSKWKSADQKFREAAEARKSVESFMKALEEDPEAVLNDKRLPLNKKKLAEKWIMEQIEAELNPPDPRDAKLSDVEKRLKAYEDKERQEAEAVQAREYEQAKEARKTAISNTLAEAMKSTQLSAHPDSQAALLREMAMYMRAAKERGEEVTPDQIVEHIHNNRFHQLYTLAHQHDGEELIEMLGEEIVGRIRKADLARLKAQREPQATHKNDQWAAPAEKKPAKRMDAWEAREHTRKLLDK